MSLSVRRNPNPKRERGIARPSLTRRVRMGPSLTRRVGMGPSLTRRVGIVIVLTLLDPSDRRMAKGMIVL
jgi:hypothetical protein